MSLKAYQHNDCIFIYFIHFSHGTRIWPRCSNCLCSSLYFNSGAFCFQSCDLAISVSLCLMGQYTISTPGEKRQHDIMASRRGTAWWRHQMETFSALLALCAGNSPVTGEFPEQRPVTLSIDIFFVLHLNKRLSKQSWGWWFETPSCPLWCHCNEMAAQFRRKLASYASKMYKCTNTHLDHNKLTDRLNLYA